MSDFTADHDHDDDVETDAGLTADDQSDEASDSEASFNPVTGTAADATYFNQGADGVQVAVEGAVTNPPPYDAAEQVTEATKGVAHAEAQAAADAAYQEVAKEHAGATGTIRGEVIPPEEGGPVVQDPGAGPLPSPTGDDDKDGVIEKPEEVPGGVPVGDAGTDTLDD